MASLQLQNVNDEKAKAMRRFHRKRKLETIFRWFNLCAALWLFWRYSWFLVQTLWHFYALFVAVLNNPLLVILLVNAIILSVYALTKLNDGPSDLYDELLNNSESCPKDITQPVAPPANNPEHSNSKKQTPALDPPENQIEKVESSDKETICSESLESSESPVSQETVTAVTETTTTTSCCTTFSSAMTSNGEKVSEEKCYRRVQSESFERRVVVGPRRRLKKLNTDLSSGLENRLWYVDELSKEEFNRTVEDFIAEHKRRQWEEHKKTEYCAIIQ